VGWKATLMFVAAGAIIAFFGGILMEKMGVEKYMVQVLNGRKREEIDIFCLYK
jgi:hypothetical protein